MQEKLKNQEFYQELKSFIVELFEDALKKSQNMNSLKYRESDNHISIGEASVLVGLSVKTIYKKTHLKEIPFYKVPGSNKIFFKRDEL
ncbi:hypothetical protein EOM09_06415 [bacterium]|nr:hypothetical protein [bacterium]